MNRLLIWMSFLGHGSWPQFRSAVERFNVESADRICGESDKYRPANLPSHQSAKFSLQRLAHAEFSSSDSDSDWRIVPSSLAVSKRHSKWTAVCCGARSPSLQKHIETAGYDVTVKTEAREDAPDAICLEASSFSDLVRLSSKLGFKIQINAPLALLSAILPVDDCRNRFLGKAPPGTNWKIERFLPGELSFKAVNRENFQNTDTGLFRFQMKHQRFYYLRWNSHTYLTQEGQTGKFAVLHRSRARGLHLLEYSYKRATLSVPWSCRPPLLIERALILCSGHLPCVNTETNRLVYDNVPDDVTRLVGALLRQRVKLI